MGSSASSAAADAASAPASTSASTSASAPASAPVSTSASASAPVVVFDLDGTLADTRHRLHHLAGAKRDWAAFFRDADRDPLLAEGAALAHAKAADHTIVYVTGRPERCRKATRRWLRQHGLPEGRLYMRREGDRRAARVSKPEMVRALARGGTRVVLAVDDDPEVCEAYRAAGVPVLAADWMERAPELTRAQQDEGRT